MENSTQTQIKLNFLKRREIISNTLEKLVISRDEIIKQTLTEKVEAQGTADFCRKRDELKKEKDKLYNQYQSLDIDSCLENIQEKNAFLNYPSNYKPDYKFIPHLNRSKLEMLIFKCSKDGIVSQGFLNEEDSDLEMYNKCYKFRQNIQQELNKIREEEQGFLKESFKLKHLKKHITFDPNDLSNQKYGYYHEPDEKEARIKLLEIQVKTIPLDIKIESLQTELDNIDFQLKNIHISEKEFDNKAPFPLVFSTYKKEDFIPESDEKLAKQRSINSKNNLI